MLRLIGIVASIGLADSLNPSTLAPALFLATTSEHPRESLGQFIFGVFLVYFVGGALIAFGPGELVLSLVPKPNQTTREVLEVIAGVVLLGVAALLWKHREKLGAKQFPTVKPGGRGAWLLGASITAIELPTAFPYFGALAVIMGSDVGFLRQLLLILIFNFCFLLPLLCILAILYIWKERANAVLARVGGFLQRHWPELLAGIAVIAGLVTIVLGLTGTVRATRSLIRKV